MALYHREREVVSRYHLGKSVVALYHAGKLVWELVMGFIFTKERSALFTKDGQVIKCKDQ